MRGLALLISLLAVPLTAGAARDPRIAGSPNWKNGKFVNNVPRSGKTARGFRMMREFFFKDYPDREPGEPLPVRILKRKDFPEPPADGTEFVWLGHSSIILEIGGKRLLFDPVLGKRASPVFFAGPKRFQPPAVSRQELPRIDAVVISHDHYDHLDKKTMKALIPGKARYVVPLGVGERLRWWKVRKNRVAELDWWEETSIGDVTLTAVPARHFSGRGLGDRDETLWCSWVVSSGGRRVYFSGDTGVTPDFAKIAEKSGPMDLCFIKIAAYSHLWPDTHLTPEQALAAHRTLGGKLLVPIHWGTFNLAMHPWYEPIERFVQAGEERKARFMTPEIGERVRLGTPRENTYWWRPIMEEQEKVAGK